MTSVDKQDGNIDTALGGSIRLVQGLGLWEHVRKKNPFLKEYFRVVCDLARIGEVWNPEVEKNCIKFRINLR